MCIYTCILYMYATNPLQTDRISSISASFGGLKDRRIYQTNTEKYSELERSRTFPYLFHVVCAGY